jgi:hypothetical protein
MGINPRDFIPVQYVNETNWAVESVGTYIHTYIHTHTHTHTWKERKRGEDRSYTMS